MRWLVLLPLPLPLPALVILLVVVLLLLACGWCPWPSSLWLVWSADAATTIVSSSSSSIALLGGARCFFLAADELFCFVSRRTTKVVSAPLKSTIAAWLVESESVESQREMPTSSSSNDSVAGLFCRNPLGFLELFIAPPS